MTARSRLLAAVAVVAVVGGCGDDPLDDARDAHQQLSAAYGHYMAVEEPEDPVDWEAFFSDGKRRVDELQRAYETFEEATLAALDAGVADADTHRRYLELMGTWVATQVEQVDRSSGCMQQADPAPCFAELVSDELLVMPLSDRAELQRLSGQLYGH